MANSYEIIYNLDRDVWNWFYGTNYSDNWRQLTDQADLVVVKKITGLESEAAAKPILRPHLQAKQQDNGSQLNQFLKVAQAEFEEKFDAACQVLEKITGRSMVDGKFTFFVTTFPRMTVFFDERIIFMYAKIDEELWGYPIDGFLHEGLHFQFDHYWRQDPASPVYQLLDDDYFKLKESLTVILDDELKPIITLPDSSYSEFADLRSVLHQHWRQHHDFEQLVELGLAQLKNK